MAHRSDEDNRARMALYHEACAQIYRELFPESDNEDQLWKDEVWDMLLHDELSNKSGERVMHEVGQRVRQRRVKSRDAATVIQMYLNPEGKTSAVMPMYECHAESARLNMTAEAIPTVDDGKLVYRQGEYRWLLVATGKTITRVSDEGAYESTRDVANWLERKALERKFVEAFSGA